MSVCVVHCSDPLLCLVCPTCAGLQVEMLQVPGRSKGELRESKSRQKYSH